jgi:hypothetical protein
MIIFLKFASEFVSADPEVRVQFLALLDFLRISGAGTWSTQPHEYVEEMIAAPVLITGSAYASKLVAETVIFQTHCSKNIIFLGILTETRENCLQVTRCSIVFAQPH